ncbi:MAG: hypothetical protein M1817_006751 [Caeruleum heppii]|nr:MAG: hypothetical protein M1817_006751 [Caeruleum heppii]
MASTSSGAVDVKNPSNPTVPTPSGSNDDGGAPPTAPTSEKVPDDSSKLRTFLSILRKFVGVADIASVRFSLPAQLLEPTPNLEYWGYLDRPETFISIGDSDDPLERMLAVLRFWFTKDLKYVKGKPCKPYNSALGEFFRCNWEVEAPAPPVRIPISSKEPTSSSASSSTFASATSEPVTTASNKPITVSYLTEQTSHHPPVSAFFISCPAKGISARGYDQLSAKFTGTSIRVTPGAHNLGIFVTLHERGEEEYQLTHPAAHLGGILRGSLNVSVADSCFMTCPKTKLKVILHYLEDGWLGRVQNKVEGVIYQYDPETDKRTRIKDVPAADVVARIEGSWMDKVYFTLTGSSDKHLLTDLAPLNPIPKIVPPPDAQLPTESRRFWAGVTAAIHAREFSRATALKQELEEKQRVKASERREKGGEYRPRFFQGVVTPVGRPELSEEGREALRRAQGGDWGGLAEEGTLGS